MGYTHYWLWDADLDKSKLALAYAEVKKIVAVCQELGIDLRGPHGEGEPKTATSVIQFNWAKEKGEDAEPFMFPFAGRRRWSFCKTDHKPYDLAVCAVLLTLKYHLGPQIRVGSDGGKGEEGWGSAERLVATVLGYHVIFEPEETC